MYQQQIEAPLFPVMPRPLQERMAAGLMTALWRWAMSGSMRGDDTAALSRHTGGHA
jgi:hypothetical protein